MSLFRKRKTSAFCALVWKEWRETWPLVVLGAVPAIFLPAVFCVYEDRRVMLCAFAAVALSSALLAARAFADEAERGTGAFLLALPASRASVWWSKMLLALVGPFWFAAGVLGACFVCGYFVGPPRGPIADAAEASAAVSAALTAVLERSKADFLIGLAAIPFAGAALSAFFSVVITNTLTALLAASACAWALGAICRASYPFYEALTVDGMVMQASKFWGWAALFAALVAVLALCGSYAVFRKKTVPR